jgi:hypothetical protein
VCGYGQGARTFQADRVPFAFQQPVGALLIKQLQKKILRPIAIAEVSESADYFSSNRAY